MTINCKKCNKEVLFLSRDGYCDICQKEIDTIRHNQLVEEGKRKREKTIIGIRYNFGEQYFDQELHVNCKPNDVYINGRRWNEDYKDLYQEIVDLCHQILIDGNNLNENGDYGEHGWYESLECTANGILDKLKE